jgi:hypothetical protein
MPILGHFVILITHNPQPVSVILNVGLSRRKA